MLEASRSSSKVVSMVHHLRNEREVWGDSGDGIQREEVNRQHAI
jgi:hypothetical protein